MGHHILLDNYPYDVLQKIISNVGPSKLTQLLSNSLKLSQNVKSAIDQEFIKNSYRYITNLTKPDSMTVTQSESDFVNARDFQIFDEYCVDEELGWCQRFAPSWCA